MCGREFGWTSISLYWEPAQGVKLKYCASAFCRKDLFKRGPNQRRIQLLRWRCEDWSVEPWTATFPLLILVLISFQPWWLTCRSYNFFATHLEPSSSHVIALGQVHAATKHKVNTSTAVPPYSSAAMLSSVNMANASTVLAQDLARSCSASRYQIFQILIH